MSMSPLGSQTLVNPPHDVIPFLTSPAFVCIVDALNKQKVAINCFKILSDKHQAQLNLKIRQLSSRVWEEEEASHHDLNETIGKCTTLRDEVLLKYNAFRKRPTVPFCMLDAEASKLEDRRDLLNDLLRRLNNLKDELLFNRARYDEPLEEIERQYLASYKEVNVLLVDLTKAAVQIQDIIRRDDVLLYIAHIRLDLGEIDKYSEIVSSIQTPWKKDSALSHLSSILVDAGSLVQAHDVAKSISDSDARFVAMECVLIAHSRAGEFKEAIIFALNEPDITVSKGLLLSIFRESVDLKTSEAAFTAIDTIPGKSDQDIILAAFVHVMLEQGNIVRAISAAANIQNEISQYSCFERICRHLSQLPDLENAIELVKTIPSDQFRDEAYYLIAMEFAANSNVERAKDIAMLIHSIERRDDALFGITAASTRLDLIASAHCACDAIVDAKVRDRALGRICGAYARRGDYDKAIELFRSIKIEKFHTFSMICRELRRAEDVYALVEIAKEFEAQDERDKALFGCADQMIELEKFVAAEQIAQLIRDDKIRDLCLSQIPVLPTPPSSPELEEF